MYLKAEKRFLSRKPSVQMLALLGFPPQLVQSRLGR